MKNRIAVATTIAIVFVVGASVAILGQPKHATQSSGLYGIVWLESHDADIVSTTAVDGEIEVYDVQGTSVARKKTQSGRFRFPLPPGTYKVVTRLADGSVWTTRVVEVKTRWSMVNMRARVWKIALSSTIPLKLSAMVGDFIIVENDTAVRWTFDSWKLPANTSLVSQQGTVLVAREPGKVTVLVLFRNGGAELRRFIDLTIVKP